jgi:hypothetical protein
MMIQSLKVELKLVVPKFLNMKQMKLNHILMKPSVETKVSCLRLMAAPITMQIFLMLI